MNEELQDEILMRLREIGEKTTGLRKVLEDAEPTAGVKDILILIEALENRLNDIGNTALRIYEVGDSGL